MSMTCWNCENALDIALMCDRCGMPQTIEGLDPFLVLGLPPRLNWPAVELTTTYERLAHKCHPDLFRAHRDERVLVAARGAMTALNDAYRLLQDPVARLRYVLAASGQALETPRTVPEGLQESAQIISRVVGTVEEAKEKGDRDAWEAQQDHLASLQVQVEAAEQKSTDDFAALCQAWDAAVGAARDKWPHMPEGWFEQVNRWLGERVYVDSLSGRVRAGREWNDDVVLTAAEAG